ncbi:March7, partial [Symbiodinium microadriaticum]
MSFLEPRLAPLPSIWISSDDDLSERKAALRRCASFPGYIPFALQSHKDQAGLTVTSRREKEELGDCSIDDNLTQDPLEDSEWQTMLPPIDASEDSEDVNVWPDTDTEDDFEERRNLQAPLSEAK